MIFSVSLRSFSVSSWLIHCSSSVSFFSDSLWLWFGAKKLSNVRTRFRYDMLTTARCIHHAWLSMRHMCSVEPDWNFPCSVLACNFCAEINLFVCASFRVFFPKFWRGQTVLLAIFLRDNFNCSAGLAQNWRGLAQTLGTIHIIPESPGFHSGRISFHLHTFLCMICYMILKRHFVPTQVIPERVYIAWFSNPHENSHSGTKLHFATI